jgi:hypothetical protein
VNLMFWRRDDNRPVPAPTEGDDGMHELLSAYLDGELTSSELAEVEALLAQDADARDELDDLALLVSALGELGEEVRAPRSFAITATASGSEPMSGLPSFRRMEMFFRASAAAAGLLFAVVLFADPAGNTPVSAPAMSEMTQMTAEAPAPAAAPVTALSAPDDASRSADAPDVTTNDGATPTGEAATGEAATGEATPGEPAPGAAPPDTSGGAGGGVGGGGPDANPAPPDAPTGSTEATTAAVPAPESTLDAPFGSTNEADVATTANAPELADPTLKSADAFAAPEEASGTFLEPSASDGVGGMTAALGTIAGLLTTLSVLLAWDRRSRGTPPHQ